MVIKKLAQGVLIATVASNTAYANDKSAYTLFNPTPANQMRELSTDRPDKTESPYTVDAGHFQVEMDFINYTHDTYKKNGENLRTRGYSIAPVNLKAGLTNNMDLQVVVETYNHVRTSDRNAGTRDTASGFGDITTRLKYNIWGNDGGDTALAIMPFVKFPTNQDNLGNDDVEGGVIIPFGFSLTEKWGMGVMTELDINKSEGESGYEFVFVNTATVGTDLNEKTGIYFEIFTAVPEADTAEWVATFDMGITYAITDNLQFDCGVNIGLTEAADDFNPFMGISARF